MRDERGQGGVASCPVPSVVGVRAQHTGRSFCDLSTHRPFEVNTEASQGREPTKLGGGSAMSQSP